MSEYLLNTQTCPGIQSVQTLLITNGIIGWAWVIGREVYHREKTLFQKESDFPRGKRI